MAAKSFIDFILECEGKGGGAILRDYMATDSYDKMVAFFAKKDYAFQEQELKKLWKAKAEGNYFSIDYEYINGPGKSY